MNLIATLTFLFCYGFVSAQNSQTEPINVYVSQLPENVFFQSHNKNINAIEGLSFLLMADGKTSTVLCPTFETQVFLLPANETTLDKKIVIKTYLINQLTHLGMLDFSNQVIFLPDSDILKPGEYKVGILVNANQAFSENLSDNVFIIPKALVIGEN